MNPVMPDNSFLDELSTNSIEKKVSSTNFARLANFFSTNFARLARKKG